MYDWSVCQKGSAVGAGGLNSSSVELLRDCMLMRGMSQTSYRPLTLHACCRHCTWGATACQPSVCSTVPSAAANAMSSRSS